MKRTPSGLVELATLLLLTSSWLGAAPAHALTAGVSGASAEESDGPLVIIPTVNTSPSQPAWAVLFPATQGNYPGGNEEFSVFVVDSSTTSKENMTIYNMTLTAPFGSNSAIGLPTLMTPGQSVLSTIYLQIPADFTGENFTANLVANIAIANSTGITPGRLTGSALVYMLALPGTTGQTTSGVLTSGTSGGGVSSSLFYAGVGVPSVVAILLALVLVIRGRPKPAT